MIYMRESGLTHRGSFIVSMRVMYLKPPSSFPSPPYPTTNPNNLSKLVQASICNATRSWWREMCRIVDRWYASFLAAYGLLYSLLSHTERLHSSRLFCLREFVVNCQKIQMSVSYSLSLRERDPPPPSPIPFCHTICTPQPSCHLVYDRQRLDSF